MTLDHKEPNNICSTCATPEDVVIIIEDPTSCNEVPETESATHVRPVCAPETFENKRNDGDKTNMSLLVVLLRHVRDGNIGL